MSRVKTQFGGEQVSLGLPRHKDNSGSGDGSSAAASEDVTQARKASSDGIVSRRCGITQEVKSTVQARYEVTYIRVQDVCG